MKLYVCGPMTGLPEHNFPAFKAATALLRSMGHEAVCPTEISVECGCEPGAHTWEEYLTRDIRYVTEVDGLCLLPNWDLSRGATFEVFVANKLGKEFYWLNTFGELSHFPRSGVVYRLKDEAVREVLLK